MQKYELGEVAALTTELVEAIKEIDQLKELNRQLMERISDLELALGFTPPME